MERLTEGRKILKNIITILTIISFTVTAVVGFVLITNYQEIGRMAQVAIMIKTQYLEEVPMKQIMQGAVRGMVASLGDPYSAFMDAKQFQELQRHIQGSIGGIGIYVGEKDKKLTVMSTIEGTPASKAGIKSGDIIIKIDDKFTSELEMDEAVAMMRGNPGTQVRVGIMREGVAKLLEFTLTREIIDIPTVESQVLPKNKNIGYIRLKMFASNSDEAMGKELEKLLNSGVKGLILDLRDDPGGDLDAAVNIARYFVPKGPVVYTVDKGGRTSVYENTMGERLKLPLVVLINEGSASASEVLAGAIKDTKSGILVGERTFGKGIVQMVFPLGGGDGLKLTTSKYLTPNKIDIHKKGIEPDIKVELTPKDKEDVQLNKAIEVLESKIGK
ncbi:MAG: carboxyl-terminal protease [Peptococcaceae bacterium]|nr:carboxyl-terminal protease [Peptococcaceae bacterium]